MTILQELLTIKIVTKSLTTTMPTVIIKDGDEIKPCWEFMKLKKRDFEKKKLIVTITKATIRKGLLKNG
ncbi:unnamed protein product [Gongylonema pulchrum]|uniref:Ubiquitin-like domain-containing protein n=1 Tax=Gongylonema pulchrum TaxID=637853 RepID=A0A183DHL7_9BILA|nr:unnamed protein product [Gongylonema pulchrum]